MTDAAVDWSSLLSDLGVPGVPGVPAQKSATFSGTPAETAGVPGVPPTRAEHLGTPSEHLSAPSNSLKNNAEHLGTPGTPDFKEGGLANNLRTGLDRLQRDRQPRISNPGAWPVVVADALRLEKEGWAAQAIALGWHPLQLFGCSPAVGGDPDLDSLAVWLAGRRLVLIDGRRAVAAEGDLRSVFVRRSWEGAAFLWDLADIQSRRAKR